MWSEIHLQNDTAINWCVLSIKHGNPSYTWGILHCFLPWVFTWELTTCCTPTSLTQLQDLLKIEGKILRFFVFRKEQMVLQLSPAFYLPFVTMATKAIAQGVKKTIFHVFYTRVTERSTQRSTDHSTVWIALVCKPDFKNCMQKVHAKTQYLQLSWGFLDDLKSSLKTQSLNKLRVFTLILDCLQTPAHSLRSSEAFID